MASRLSGLGDNLWEVGVKARAQLMASHGKV
jgi:hypothetical protein